VLEIARNTADLIGLNRPITADDVVLKEDYAYPAYGVPSAETNEAKRSARPLGPLPSRRQGALRPSRRRSGDQRLQPSLSQRVRLDSSVAFLL